MQGLLLENAKLINAFVPLNITGSAQTSSWIALTFWRRVCFLIMGGAWAGGTPAVTLNQAQDNAGTGSKALAFTRYFLFDTTTLDKPVETAVTSNTYNLAAQANQTNAIEVHAQDLDIANGFNHVQLAVASPGANADLLAIAAIAYDSNWAGKPATLPSALA